MSVTDIFQRARNWFNNFQRSHAWIGFPLAVLKKYGDDRANDYAGLITYYAFVSLFPLLLLLLTVLELLMAHNAQLRSTILSALFDNFPLLSDELSKNVNAGALRGSVWRLIFSGVFTLLGSLGVANAVRLALSDLWQIPRTRRSSFPLNYLQGMVLIVIAGIGLGATAYLGHHPALPWLVARPAAILLAIGMFALLFWIATDRHIPIRRLLWGAAFSAVGLHVLQSVGWLLVRHELQRLGVLYGAFAIVLGLLAWIYLQARLMLYAIEVDVVIARHLWPRSLNDHLTHADRRTIRGYATTEKRHDNQTIDVTFHDKLQQQTNRAPSSSKH